MAGKERGSSACSKLKRPRSIKALRFVLGRLGTQKHGSSSCNRIHLALIDMPLVCSGKTPKRVTSLWTYNRRGRWALIHRSLTSPTRFASEVIDILEDHFHTSRGSYIHVLEHSSPFRTHFISPFVATVHPWNTGRGSYPQGYGSTDLSITALCPLLRCPYS